jgi:hypothetical protein
MIELIAFTILFGSLCGMAVILFQKIPILIKLAPGQSEQVYLLRDIEKKIEKIGFLHLSYFENFLQKILRQCKILTLKTENKITALLERLQQKSKNNTKKPEDNYWQELKKSIKKTPE